MHHHAPAMPAVPRFALAVLLVGLCAGACQTTTDQVRGTSNIVTLDEAPSRHLGNQVTIAGEVDTVYGPGVYRVESDGGIVDEEVLVVVPPRTALRTPDEDQDITVRGVVRAYDLEALRAEIDGLDGAALDAAAHDLGVADEGISTIIIVADRVDLPDFAPVTRAIPDAGLPPRRGWVNAIERNPVTVPKEPGELP